MSLIYSITNTVNGRVYIGKTTNDLTVRQGNHLSTLKYGRGVNSDLQSDYDKFGVSAFVFEVVEQIIDDADINEREDYWINKQDSPYNFKNNSHFIRKAQKARCASRDGKTTITIHIDKEIKEQLKQKAHKSGLTMSQVVEALFDAWLSG